MDEVSVGASCFQPTGTHHHYPASAASPPEPDPGFVFLGTQGRTILARLSQDSFEGSTPVALAGESTWSALGITCRISATRVRCANRSGHGFTIGKHSYEAF
jgi:hypothetical protein